MNTPAAKLLQIYRTSKRIDHLSVDEDVKKRLKRTYRKALFPRRAGSGGDAANIAGFNMKYLTPKTFHFLFTEIFLNQDYLFRTDTDAPFIIDCGSNIGMSLLYFRLLYPKAEIVGFEPDPRAFKCLKHNVETNDFGQVDVHQKAVAATEGEIDFYYNEAYAGSLGMSTVKERLPRQAMKVPCVRLSPFIVKEVDFLKMDIEGAEMSVIEELRDAGKLQHIKQMVIEYHHHIVPGVDELSRMLKVLEDAGFGYQVESPSQRPLQPRRFQDLLLYAYRKADEDQ